MKRVTLTLLIGALFLLGACSKEDVKQNESGGIKPITEIFTPQGSSTKLASEWGDTISSSEASTITARFTTLYSSWTLDFRLNDANYTTVSGVSGSTTTGFFHAKNGGMMVFPVDDYGEIVDTMGFEANSTGGTAISLANAIAKMDTLYMPTTGHPEATFFGTDIVDDVIEQDGADGIIISNAVKIIEGKDCAEIVLSAYGEGMGATIYVSNGGKECGTWVAGHFIQGAPNPVWIPAHWEPCGALAQAMWNIFH